MKIKVLLIIYFLIPSAVAQETVRNNINPAFKESRELDTSIKLQTRRNELLKLKVDEAEYNAELKKHKLGKVISAVIPAKSAASGTKNTVATPIYKTAQIKSSWVKNNVYKAEFIMPSGEVFTAGLGDILPDGSEVIGLRMNAAILQRQGMTYSVGVSSGKEP